MSGVLTVEHILRAMRYWDGFTPGSHRYMCADCREFMANLGDHTKHTPDCPVGKALKEMTCQDREAEGRNPNGKPNPKPNPNRS